MFTFIITAAIYAAFAAAIVVFFKAFMNFFDMVIKGIKSLFKAIKVMIKRKNGKVEAGVMTQKENGDIELVTDPTKVEPLDEKEVMDNPDLVQAFAKAKPMGKRQEKIIAVDDEQIRKVCA